MILQESQREERKSINQLRLGRGSGVGRESVEQWSPMESLEIPGRGSRSGVCYVVIQCEEGEVKEQIKPVRHLMKLIAAKPGQLFLGQRKYL